MELGEKQPIIIVKKKVAHQAHHGGAWKVAYADFVTAMMAFFLVMWLVGSQSDVVKSAIGAYFRDPVHFKEQAGKGMLQGSSSTIVPMENGPDDRVEQMHAEQLVQRRLNTAGEEVRAALHELPGLSEIGNQVDVAVVDEGLRIQLLETEEPTFFEIGSPKLSPRGERAVAAIARVIGPLGYHVAIEGHTDSRPLRRAPYSNWELSSDRANSARRILEERGVAPANIASVRAFAATHPLLPKAPEDARNRRIAIVVLDPRRDAPKDGVDLSERARIALRDASPK